MPDLKGWRTILTNVLVLGLAWLNTNVELIDLTSDEQGAVVITALAAVNILLRIFTTTPVGSSS